MAKLFVVGFPKNFSQVDLMEMFSLHGTVNTVTVITDQDTGVSKCYGFVTMTDDMGANRAITALNGSNLNGRTISVRLTMVKNALENNVTIAPVKRKKRPRRS